jgi:hypothetical protein
MEDDVKGDVLTKLELLASHIGFDDSFELTYDQKDGSIFLCFFSLQAFRRHARATLILSQAFTEICRQDGIDTSDRNFCKNLLQTRPDLMAQARQLATDPIFISSVIDNVRIEAEHQMKFITPESIRDAVTMGIEILWKSASENLLDESLTATGNVKRHTKEKQQSSVNTARNFFSNVAGITRGRDQGIKSNPVIFSYKKLRIGVRDVDKNSTLEKSADLPKQKNVATHMGYKGNDPAVQLGNDLRRNQSLLKKNGHSTHKWKQLCREILGEN